MMDKKVAFIGNLGNCTYWYVKHLRETGIDAWLYIVFKKRGPDGQPIIPVKQDPRAEDRELKGKLPFWIKFFHIYSLKNLLNLRKEFNQYGLNIAFEAMPIFLQFCRKPLISFGTGSNLREEVFKKGIKSFLLKRGFLKSKMLLFDNIDIKTLESLERLGVKKYKWIPDYFSREDLLKTTKDSRIKGDFLKKFKEKFICFYPARVNFHQKGTDILIKGFADFERENSNLARLLLIDWGEDKEELKKLIDELGLREKVSFLPVLSYPEVLNLIKKSSLIFGYFRNGSSGIHHFPLVIEETLALGNIIISSIDQSAFKEIVGEKPQILEAFSKEDIKNQLKFVIKNYPQLKRKFGKKGPDWVKKYCSKEFIRPKLVKIIKEYAQ